MFAKIVQRTIDRIYRLPGKACAFVFTAWKEHLMIGLLVAVGLTLRNSPVRKELLAIVYTVMGGMLLLGRPEVLSEVYRASPGVISGAAPPDGLLGPPTHFPPPSIDPA